MTYRLDTGPIIPDGVAICYKWWVNFVDHHGIHKGWSSFDELDAELARYNARFVRSMDKKIPHRVEFKNERDATLFLLKWS